MASFGHNDEAGLNDRENEIIDIRSDAKEFNLLQELKESLHPHDGSAPSFLHMLLWDEEGLKYFEKITYLKDYYPTHNEISLLEKHSEEIASRIKPGSWLIELGSGNLRKIRILLQALDRLGREVDYFALDLNHEELKRSLALMPPGTFKHVRCHGLLGTYDDALGWLKHEADVERPKCVVSLGSSIGSFTRDEAPDFLRGFVEALKSSKDGSSGEPESTMLLGLDACQTPSNLARAYNDPDGVWDGFILNGLKHANQLLGYDAFRPEDWAPVGSWNDETGCYERHLLPLRKVTFEEVTFRPGDRLFISHSCKYNPAEQGQLWEKAELKELHEWSTDDRIYGLHLLSC